MDRLAEALAGGGAALVNVQHANHEVGTIQPISQVATLCRAADALLHVDACQTVGRLPVSLVDLGADYVSLSAAKFGGGRGVGALLTAPRARFRAQLSGDEREGRRRSGLQNLPGIAALAETLATLRARSPSGEAAREVTRADAVRRHLRRALSQRLVDVEVHGPTEQTLPHLVAFSVLYVDGQALVAALDAAGWQVHSGSSCATSSGEPSHVLVAMGALTHGHVRVSFDEGFTTAEADRFVADLGGVVAAERARLAM
jgi:cysteine desulfurase